MRKDNVTEPITDNKERARGSHRESKREHEGGASRAAEEKSGGESEKKGGSAPKQGGNPR